MKVFFLLLITAIATSTIARESEILQREPDIKSVPAKLEDYYTYDKVTRKWIWNDDYAKLKQQRENSRQLQKAKAIAALKSRKVETEKCQMKIVHTTTITHNPAKKEPVPVFVANINPKTKQNITPKAEIKQEPIKPNNLNSPNNSPNNPDQKKENIFKRIWNKTNEKTNEWSAKFIEFCQKQIEKLKKLFQ